MTSIQQEIVCNWWRYISLFCYSTG